MWNLLGVQGSIHPTPGFALREGKQCLRIVKANCLPGTLRELLMLIRRFSVWKANNGSQALPARERRGSRNRLLEGAIGGSGIDNAGFDNPRGPISEVEVGSTDAHFQFMVAPGACLGG